MQQGEEGETMRECSAKEEVLDTLIGCNQGGGASAVGGVDGDRWLCYKRSLTGGDGGDNADDNGQRWCWWLWQVRYCNDGTRGTQAGADVLYGAADGIIVVVVVMVVADGDDKVRTT